MVAIFVIMVGQPRAVWGLSYRIRCSLVARFGTISCLVPDASQEMVNCCAWPYSWHIESLPDKYDTIVDDDQNIFSTGQKQLISIAKFCWRTWGMILDERLQCWYGRFSRPWKLLWLVRTSFVVPTPQDDSQCWPDHRSPKTERLLSKVIITNSSKLGGFYSELS